MERMFDRIAMSVVAVGLIGSPAASAETMTPLDRVASTPKGELKSPYADIAAVAEQGRQIYRSLDCGGCDGGGGGMAALLTNEVWVYGNDDDTLFRLIVLGTGSLSIGDGFAKQGFVRKGSENVVGPMAPRAEARTRSLSSIDGGRYWTRTSDPCEHRGVHTPRTAVRD